jgi:hypothetical protein
MIGIVNNKYNSGFRMSFSNGLTISVQIGTVNYCENRRFFPDDKFDTERPNECKNAEIAIWDEANQSYNFEPSSQEKGWVSIDEVAQWIFAVQTATSIDGIKRP